MTSVTEKPRPRDWGPEKEEPPSFPLLRQEVPKFRNFVDEHGLITASTPDGQFHAYFGRDTEITIFLSLEAMAAPSVARQELTPFVPVFRKNLVFLAQNQSQEYDPKTQGKPGKIHHEIRRGPFNQEWLKKAKKEGAPVKGEEGNLWMRTYFSVDSTPLFVIAAHRFEKVTGDYSLREEISPQIEKACEYLLTHQDPKTGLVLFEGPYQQNWKDSQNSAPSPPIYYTEVQGYYHLAELLGAKFLEGKNPQLATQLRERAAKLKKSFNQLFWWPEQGYFYQALRPVNGHLEPVKEVTSNPGHCLCCEIIDPEKIPSVAKRLMTEDLMGSVGIRTLSSESQSFDLSSYHNGPPWTHDNALIVQGLRKNSYSKEADIVSTNVLAQLLALGGNRGFAAAEFHSEIPTPAGFKPALWEELAKTHTPPNKSQAWAWAGIVFLLASQPSYTPPQDWRETPAPQLVAV